MTAWNALGAGGGDTASARLVPCESNTARQWRTNENEGCARGQPQPNATRTAEGCASRVTVRSGYAGCLGPPLMPHGVPKRSVSMPKASAQKVSPIGMSILPPPSASASNTRRASAAVG